MTLAERSKCSMADCRAFPVIRACSAPAILALLFLASAQALDKKSADGGTDTDSPPKLLLVSFDGFGWNFLGKLPRSQLPNFDAFIKQGVHVRWVENVFPTLTRPNHMSLVSGLYTESHGIVSNDFYDPVLGTEMPSPGLLVESDSKWVDVGAEPVWVTNSQAGEGRRSGTIYWPCADARIKGRLPDEIKRGEWTVSEDRVSPYQRIDWALDWLTGESTRPLNFAAVYMTQPDEIAHAHGPDSQEVLDAIISRDKIVEYLMSKIKQKNLKEKLNVIITADHGMKPIYPELIINIDLFVDPSWYTAYPALDWGKAMVNIWPKTGFYQQIVDGLTGKHRNLKVETSSSNENLLALHYSTSRRIAPIVLIAEPGWVIGTNKTMFESGVGKHGWDPRYAPLMYPFFLAAGPAFKQGLRNAEPFHIVDIYPLMCHILGLEPAPNNGSLSKTVHILSLPPVQNVTSPPELPPKPSNYSGIAIGILVLILAVVFFVVIIRYVRKKKNVSASYKRTFAKAGSADDLMEDTMVVISDEEL